MSYNTNVKNALNQNLPIEKRIIAVLNCIENIYYSVNVVTFSQIRNYYKKQKLIFPLTNTTNIDVIINELIKIRNQTLILKNKYSIHRRDQKAKGIRIPSQKDEISISINEEILNLWKKYTT